MIIATELGKDPLLRQMVRDAFKTDALIDEHNQYYVSLGDELDMKNDNLVDEETRDSFKDLI